MFFPAIATEVWLCVWLVMAALAGHTRAQVVTPCNATLNSRHGSPEWFACLTRGQELVRCWEMLGQDYCPSVCVAHTIDSKCVCEGRADENELCYPVGHTPGWTGRRGEIRVNPCVPCNTLLLDLPCEGFSVPSWCDERSSSPIHCSTWEECATEREFDVSESNLPCPDDRQGPYCQYAPPDESLMDVSLFDTLTFLESEGLTIPVGHEAVVSLRFAWDAWRHKEDLRTSDVRILASGSASNLEVSPCRDVTSNGSHITCSWDITYEVAGIQDILFNISYKYDHSYRTVNGRRSRALEWGRVFSFPVQVTPDPDGCVPGAEVRGISTERKTWIHEPWRRLLVEGVFIPVPSCFVSAEDLLFCWHIEHRPYVPSLDPLFSYPQPAKCAVVVQCSQSFENSQRLDLPAHSLDYGFYTIQLGISLNRDPSMGLVPFKCATGYVTLAPSPLRVRIEGDLSRTHVQATPLVLATQAQDPDVPQGKIASHLAFIWSCNTTDPDPGAVCRSPLEADRRVKRSEDGRRLTVTQGALSAGKKYTFTVSVSDIRSHLGREAVKYSQEVLVLSDPIPSLKITCEKYCDTFQVHPEDRWVLHVKCETCEYHPIPVYYQWKITHQGAPDDEFDWRDATEGGENAGMELTTVAVRPGKIVPGATYDVEVRGQFRPVTQLDFMHFNHLAGLMRQQQP